MILEIMIKAVDTLPIWREYEARAGCGVLVIFINLKPLPLPKNSNWGKSSAGRLNGAALLSAKK